MIQKVTIECDGGGDSPYPLPPHSYLRTVGSIQGRKLHINEKTLCIVTVSNITVHKRTHIHTNLFYVNSKT